jgi:hypothetical protein
LEFDKLLRSALQSIANIKLSETQWLQATLPVKHGGFGLPATEIVANAAFTANALEGKEYILRRLPMQVQRIIDPMNGENIESRFTQAFTSFLDHTKNAFLTTEDDNPDEQTEEKWNDTLNMHLENLTLQYFLTNVVSKYAKKGIKEQLDHNTRALEHGIFLSVAKQHTGDFLLACPKTPSTTFQPVDFIFAVRARRGCDLPNLPARCSCKRKPYLNKKGTHLLSCAKGGSLIHRHDALMREVKALALSAGVQASSCNKDVVFRNGVANDNRMGDLLLPQCGENQKNLIVDFTITYPCSKSKLAATRNNPSSSIKDATKRKNEKYKESAAACDTDFMPMALECYGALSVELIHIIRLLSEKRADLANSNKSVVAQYWYKRISCTLQKGNSRAIAKKLLDIAQVNHADGNDECYDPIIDQEYANNDTSMAIRS